VFLTIGVLGAIISGVLMPAVSIVMGEILNVFTPSNNDQAVLDEMRNLTIYISIVGGV
jgi:hypothetical protein